MSAVWAVLFFVGVAVLGVSTYSTHEAYTRTLASRDRLITALKDKIDAQDGLIKAQERELAALRGLIGDQRNLINVMKAGAR